MNCVLWSMGDAFLHGMGTSSGARQCGVTHVPGLKCYLCLRTVPSALLPSDWSGPASPVAQPQRSAHDTAMRRMRRLKMRRFVGAVLPLVALVLLSGCAF